MNILFGCYFVDHDTKAINLFNNASVKAMNSVSVTRVLSAALDGHERCWNDVVLTSDSAEYARRSVK